MESTTEITQGLDRLAIDGNSSARLNSDRPVVSSVTSSQASAPRSSQQQQATPNGPTNTSNEVDVTNVITAATRALSLEGHHLPNTRRILEVEHHLRNIRRHHGSVLIAPMHRVRRPVQATPTRPRPSPRLRPRPSSPTTRASEARDINDNGNRLTRMCAAFGFRHRRQALRQSSPGIDSHGQGPSDLAATITFTRGREEHERRLRNQQRRARAQLRAMEIFAAEAAARN